MPQWRGITTAPTWSRRPGRGGRPRPPFSDSIVLLLVAALLVMAATLPLIFRNRVRLLPLASRWPRRGGPRSLELVGASLTMASIAVLPVLIGLAVDYAIQFQSLRRIGAETDRVATAARGGAIAAPTTPRRRRHGAGFLVLLLSPVPMFRASASCSCRLRARLRLRDDPGHRGADALGALRRARAALFVSAFPRGGGPRRRRPAAGRPAGAWGASQARRAAPVFSACSIRHRPAAHGAGLRAGAGRDRLDRRRRHPRGLRHPESCLSSPALQDQHAAAQHRRVGRRIDVTLKAATSPIPRSSTG